MSLKFPLQFPEKTVPKLVCEPLILVIHDIHPGWSTSRMLKTSCNCLRKCREKRGLSLSRWEMTMALGWFRPSHAGQYWFGQGRTSSSAQQDTIDFDLISALFASFCKIWGYQSPADVGVLHPQTASCSRDTYRHRLIYCHGSEISSARRCSLGGILLSKA